MNLKKSIAGIFLILQIVSPFDLVANSAYPANINLVNQADIDAFIATYPDLTEIDGDLKIGDFRDACTQPDITNLVGLLQLTGIGGNLHIHKTLLNDLSGLDNLQYVNGSLILSSNGWLTSFEGLNGINQLGGLKLEYDNYELSECDALSNLNNIAGDVMIYCDGINNLNGFANVTSIVGDLIMECDGLSDLQGLSNLSNIGGNLILTGNHSLVNIDHLQGLVTIYGNLFINENYSLENLDGLINLTTIHGFIFLNQNENLNDITGVENINPLTIKNLIPNYSYEEDIIITNNPILNTCNALSICTALGLFGASYKIENNATGCFESAMNCLPVFCTQLSFPALQSTNTPVDANLSWPNSINATGYKLSIGITPGGSEILNNIDVGNNTSYDPVNNFPCGAQIYVRIVPYRAGQVATGCSEQSFVTEQVVAEVVGAKVICKGSNVVLNSSGGSMYHWVPQTGLSNPYISNPIANPTSTTNYTVTVSNERGCFDTAHTQVTVNLPPMLNLSATAESGNNFNNGSATSNSVGGKTPYTFLWNNGNNTNTIQNLVPGTYKITVTDANNCGISDSITINKFVCPQLTMSSLKNNVSCKNMCNGSIKVTNLLNAIAPFSYQWNTGANSDSIVNLCAGIYKISVTDTKNCLVTDSFIVTQPEAIFITIDSVKNYSQNNAGFIKTSTNISSSGSFNWTGPNGFNSSNEDIFNLEPGCYNLVLTDSLTGCTSDTTVCISNTSSFVDIDDMQHVFVYPNPAKTFVIIDFQNNKSRPKAIVLLDYAGKELLQEKAILFKDIHALNLEEFKSGMYFIKLQYENESKNYKLLKL
jgi:hypothetical protein